MSTALPIFFSSIRKIILDDDSAFLESVALKMHGKNFSTYESPEKLLHYLLEEYKPTLNKVDFLSHNIHAAEAGTQHIINIDINPLLTRLLSSNQDISVLCVDYHMPGMKGIDFLKAINHLPMKKILITGENDYKIAIDAFNSGLVHAYIRKQDIHFSDLLKNAISDLEWKYFIELSSLILDAPGFNYLRNPYLVSAFKDFMVSENIQSFYLTHIDGNFIAHTTNNEQKHILIRSKTQLETLAKLAEEDKGGSDLINKLKKGKFIPFFGDVEPWEIPAQEWDKFLYPAINIHGEQDLVWTIIDAAS